MATNTHRNKNHSTTNKGGKQMVELQSYKPYARLITIISGILLTLSILDANQLINLFPQYAQQITTIITLAGIIAPAIAQEKRVVRAEELKDKEYAGEQNDQ